MPVKVRCGECERVLNAPDAARGKAVKCPDCGARVAVPAAKAAAAAKNKTKTARPKPEATDEDGELDFARLDLRKVEDRKARVCYKCGARLGEDDDECPACGIDLTTGKLGRRAIKAQMKGPDPDLFWADCWAGSWRFMQKNIGVVGMTMLVYHILYLLTAGCASLYLWTYNLPPKFFAGVMMSIFQLATLGWYWWVIVKVIEATMDRRDKMKRFHFDFFMSVAMAIKAIVWSVIFFLPFNGAVGGLIYLENLLGALLVTPAYAILLAFTFPTVMAHNAMPVQWKAWLPWEMLRIGFRQPIASAYVMLVCFVTSIPVLAINGAVGAIWGPDAQAAVIQQETRNALKLQQQRQIKQNQDKARNEAPVDVIGDDQIPSVPDLKVFIAPAVAQYVTTCLLLPFTIVFNSRVFGLYAYYFKKNLDLIAESKLKKYVAKEVDEWDPVPDKVTPFGTTFIALMLLPVAAYLVHAAITQKWEELMVPYGIGLAIGVPIALALAGAWVVFMKAGEQGSSCLVPFYNGFVAARIAQKPGWWTILAMIPIVNIVVFVEMAKAFRKNPAFGVGLGLLPFIFFPIMALDDSRFLDDRQAAAKKYGKRESDGEEGDEESDEEEDE